MLTELETWIETHPKVFGLAAVLVPLAFKRLRVIPFDVFRMAQRWVMKEGYAWREEFKKDVLGRLDSIEDKAQRADKALFNGGRSGIAQQMQILVAESNVGFETSPWPSFKCDQAGCNILTNAAYRRLVGATRSESLAGHQWQTATYGDLEDKYKADFALASERGEDFIGECDFRNPHTGEHVGQWRVIAPVVAVGDGLIYLGVLKVPMDETAVEIASGFAVAR